MDAKQATIEAYNAHAEAFAEKFNELGARTADIEETFALVQSSNPFVLEIGCGNGRDAQEILKHTSRYLGVDISEELIRLARKQTPSGTFEVADIETFYLPQTIDLVFAFASLLHVEKTQLELLLTRLHCNLSPKGIVRISLKHANAYTERLKTDSFGTRMFYFYSQEDIQALSTGFLILKNEIIQRPDQAWLEVLLQKA